MKKRAKPKQPKPKPRRVVLGVGHPWFLRDSYGIRSMVWLCISPEHRIDGGQDLSFDDLGSYNRIRLVAEVLK